MRNQSGGEADRLVAFFVGVGMGRWRGWRFLRSTALRSVPVGMTGAGDGDGGGGGDCFVAQTALLLAMTREGDGTVARVEIASSHETAVLGARDGRALGNDR